jgi:hypothetical protein
MNCRTNPSVLVTVFLLLPLLFSVSATAGNTMDVVESETGFYYTIQKGDTLWDLSRQFNNSPWLWPELWEENDQISNPHWIFPGERIRLYQKSGHQAVASQPLTTALPAAAPTQSEPFFVYRAIDRTGFIRKPPVSPSGTIFAVQSVQGVKTLISEGDIVYIHPAADAAEGSLIPGSRYLVFRLMAPTDAKDAEESIGTQHFILGIVEVVQRDADVVTGKILKSFRPIREDDLVMPYRPRSEQIALKPSTPGIDGSIITSEDHTMLTGDYMLAFIDKGRTDNIHVGQQYSIYREQVGSLSSSETTPLPPVDFGTLLVLHTEQTTSTVVILNTSNSINKGERFRTPMH